MLLDMAGAAVFVVCFAAMAVFAGIMFTIGAWIGCLIVGC